MKYQGEELKRSRLQRTVTLELMGADGKLELMDFLLTVPPIGFEQECQKRLPLPTPPTTYRRDRKGRILRDQNDRPVAIRNKDDPDYREKEAARLQQHVGVIVWKGLEHDPNVVFETAAELWESDPERFADGLTEEFRDAGLSAGHLATLVKVLVSLGTAEAVEEADADFSETP